MKCTTDQKKNDVFRSASNAARDFRGRISNRYLLNSQAIELWIHVSYFKLFLDRTDEGRMLRTEG
jgi:hypothetical protein